MNNEDIIKKFLLFFREKHTDDAIEVVGIIGFGSRFHRAKASPASDLDVYVVIKNIGKRYRGMTKVERVAVDYFVNPIERLRLDWNNFKMKTVPYRTIAYLLRDGSIIQDTDDRALQSLQQEVRAFLEQEEKEGIMTEAATVTAKYFISDYLKDLDDCWHKKDMFAWHYTMNSLLQYIVEIFCRFHRIALVKHKYQKKKIERKDSRFIELYEAVARAESLQQRHEAVNTLSRYCVERMGGPLPEEWELESEL
ncbi:hypothetical protein A3I35_01575 [Candidatus Falkowbacteria bacterium RIFCSPLOWO2_02_FULL_45_15]|uniref:Polymerase nucleotidyl transferase domain-containing protein n=2 Tax=Candidatus Falkowiibacteriota TaxID=1752728 RepID=A0A1F5RZ15_9BACT|nr:MAG: hypothetical protein A3D54_00170 [Candidatus Falkowbacteria bacterium RIFCSPHIGHO2_02_FULL_45_15]OGF20007.1 MAG: hypothetical protein A3I35_01575 [Candidatus Falkowbacteria bacterium RIFCSPLOWO2_02_FULL_45_15]